jgi:D-lactate dehydrogenase
MYKFQVDSCFIHESVDVLLQSHRALCEGVSALARRVQSDRELTNLIRRKFAIKCTTGAHT